MDLGFGPGEGEWPCQDRPLHPPNPAALSPFTCFNHQKGFLAERPTVTSLNFLCGPVKRPLWVLYYTRGYAPVTVQTWLHCGGKEIKGSTLGLPCAALARPLLQRCLLCEPALPHPQPPFLQAKEGGPRRRRNSKLWTRPAAMASFRAAWKSGQGSAIRERRGGCSASHNEAAQTLRRGLVPWGARRHRRPWSPRSSLRV